MPDSGIAPEVRFVSVHDKLAPGEHRGQRIIEKWTNRGSAGPENSHIPLSAYTDRMPRTR